MEKCFSKVLAFSLEFDSVLKQNTISFQVTSPNHVIPECVIGKKSWRLITVPMATPSLNLLREKFSELTRAEPHLGLNPRAPSLEGGVIHK